MARSHGPGGRAGTPWLRLAATGIWLGCLAATAAAQAPGEWTPVPARLEEAASSRATTLTAAEDLEGLWFPATAVFAFFGGHWEWAEALEQVQVRGPSGRTAVWVEGLPYAIADRRRVRLPVLPRYRDQEYWLTVPALQVLWEAVGQDALAYDAGQRRLLRVPNAGQARNPPGAAPTPTAVPTAAATTGASATPAPAAQTRPTDFLIVLDPGHGGKDPGAVGPSRLYEKTVTLEIALQLAEALKRELNARILFTRSDDRYIPLQDRADIANKNKADLFVSIHANASRDRSAAGSQVFIYNREASSRKAAEAARLENRDANYLEIIKDDLRQSVHESASITAAGLISRELGKTDLNVHQIERAPFYVLAKSHMPSILVETAFISNHAEERKLRSREFCRQLALGISRGLTQFAREAKAK